MQYCSLAKAKLKRPNRITRVKFARSCCRGRHFQLTLQHECSPRNVLALLVRTRFWRKETPETKPHKWEFIGNQHERTSVKPRMSYRRGKNHAQAKWRVGLIGARSPWNNQQRNRFRIRTCSRRNGRTALNTQHSFISKMRERIQIRRSHQSSAHACDAKQPWIVPCLTHSCILLVVEWFMDEFNQHVLTPCTQAVSAKFFFSLLLLWTATNETDCYLWYLWLSLA